MTTTAAFSLALIPGIQGWEWIIILVIGLLLFGKRLPDLGRSVGKTIVEFKKGLKDVEKEVEAESNRPAHQPYQPPYQAPQHGAPTLPQGGNQSGTQYAPPGAYQQPHAGQQGGQVPGSNG